MQNIKRTYTTSQVAAMVGVHPNTVRLYEKVGFITKPHYKENGYREFTDLQVDQMRFGRMALKSELIQNGLRHQEVYIVKLVAQEKWQEAIDETKRYRGMLDKEKNNAKEAIEITNKILAHEKIEERPIALTRKQAAKYLDTTVDKIRNWELNGLIKISRKQNGYRIYTNEDIRLLKIIRALRCANYSLMAILRLINHLKTTEKINVEEMLNTPKTIENMEISMNVCDQLLQSLNEASGYADYMLCMLKEMKEKY